LRQDLTTSVRGFLGNKTFTSVAVLCLSLGIATNTAVFSIFESTFLQPLPFDDPDELVSVYMVNERDDEREPLAYPHYLTIREEAGSFEEVEAHTDYAVAVSEEESSAELVDGQLISSGLFPTLGVQPQIGRGFLPDDDRLGAPPSVILSDAIWQQRFGADADIVGRAVRLNSTPHTVVGVMPPGFQYPEAAQVWIPVGTVLEPNLQETAQVEIVARLRAGVTEASLSAEIADFEDRTPSMLPMDGEPWEIETRSLGAVLIGVEERLITAGMMGAVSILLLLACTNVANMLLVRAAGRKREFALRAALGAGRRRLIQQLVIESLLLSAIAGVIAVPLAGLGLSTFVSVVPPSDPFPFYVTFSLSTRALVYTSFIAILTGLVFGLVPAFAGSQAEPSEALKSDASGAGVSIRTSRIHSGLVVTDIALAMALLVGASLFVRTFMGLQNVELGYDTSQIMTMRAYLPGPAYDQPTARVATLLDVQRRLETIPGVEFATISDLIPLEEDGGSTERVVVDGDVGGGGERLMFYAGVLGDWLRTFDVETVAGRDFDAVELQEGRSVAVINLTMADAFWPETDAIGRRFRFANDSTFQWISVIGVIPDMRTVKLDENEPTPATAFVPIQMLDTRDYGVMLRTTVAPASVTAGARDAIRVADASVPLSQVRPMDEVKYLSFWMYQLWGATFAAFGLIALFLAATGVYGVISYGVRARSREIGVRMAIGADRRAVVGLVVWRALKSAGIGLAIGAVLAVALSAALEDLLIGVSATDALIYLSTMIFLGLVALAASLVPASWAANLNATEAMRR
jgi:predicted permease